LKTLTSPKVDQKFEGIHETVFGIILGAITMRYLFLKPKKFYYIPEHIPKEDEKLSFGRKSSFLTK
jgi:hypothetical protein